MRADDVPHVIQLPQPSALPLPLTAELEEEAVNLWRIEGQRCEVRCQFMCIFFGISRLQRRGEGMTMALSSDCHLHRRALRFVRFIPLRFRHGFINTYTCTQAASRALRPTWRRPGSARLGSRFFISSLGPSYAFLHRRVVWCATARGKLIQAAHHLSDIPRAEYTQPGRAFPLLPPGARVTLVFARSGRS